MQWLSGLVKNNKKHSQLDAKDGNKKASKTNKNKVKRKPLFQKIPSSKQLRQHECIAM